MESLEDLVEKMESQMSKADSKLDLLSTRLDQFEAKVLLPEAHEGISSDRENHKVKCEDKTEGTQHTGEDATSGKVEADNDDGDDDGLDPKLLTQLLMEVRHVRKEYDTVLQNVHQVQELQQEVSHSLRKEMRQVQSRFEKLRERVIGSSSLPVNK